MSEETVTLHKTISLWYCWSNKKIKLHHTYPKKIQGELEELSINLGASSFRFKDFIYERKFYKSIPNNPQMEYRNTWVVRYDLKKR